MNTNNENEPITPEQFVLKYGETEMPPDYDGVDSPDAKQTRTKQILALSDRLLEKINLAIEEVDLYKIKVKEKTKDVEYDEETKKIINETQTEKEKAETGKSLIDTSALKQLVSTLKDIKDIHMGLTSDKPTDDENESGVIVISDVADGEA